MDVTDGGQDRLPVPDPGSYAAIIERVQSTGWTRRPDAGTRRRAWISTVAGVGMQVAAVAVFSLGVWAPDLNLLLGVAWLPAGGLLSWLGIDTLLALRDGKGELPVMFWRYCYAVISGPTISFPRALGMAPETWPLAQTTAELKSTPAGESVRLTCPGRRPRTFTAITLVQSPAEVVRIVESRKAALLSESDVALPGHGGGDGTTQWPQARWQPPQR